MRIVFATTQSSRGSSMIGRVYPLARFLSQRHNVHVLGLNGFPATPSRAFPVHSVGQEPFTRTAYGKRRYRGIKLVSNMLSSALRTAFAILRLRPDVVVITKTLPANVLGVWLAARLRRHSYVVVDMDDFELTANTLSTLWQRAAVHWSERVAVRLASGLVGASPFLTDHLEQLTGLKKSALLIPTGFAGKLPPQVTTAGAPLLLYIGSISVSSGHRVDLLPEIVSQVAAAVPAVRLRIAGDGDDVQTLREKFAAHHLEGRVEWTGRFAPADLPRLLKGVSLVLDPIDDSVAQRAKSSFRVTVALASGLPVVTSNIGVRPHLVPDPLHARLFAPPADPAGYAATIQKLLEDPLTAEEQAQLRRAAVEVQWDTLAARYERYLLNL